MAAVGRMMSSASTMLAEGGSSTDRRYPSDARFSRLPSIYLLHYVDNGTNTCCEQTHRRRHATGARSRQNAPQSIRSYDRQESAPPKRGKVTAEQ